MDHGKLADKFSNFSDFELFKLARKGDVDAQTFFFELYFRRFIVWVCHRCRWIDINDARDITQNALMKIWEKRAIVQEREEGKFSNWLFQFAKNAFFAFLNSKKRKTTQFVDLSYFFDSFVNKGSHYERICDTRHSGMWWADTYSKDSLDKDQLKEVLSLIPAFQREALHLACYEGCTVTEGARRQGVNVTTFIGRLEWGAKNARVAFEALRDGEILSYKKMKPFLHHLTEKQREAVSLIRGDGLTNEQAAHRLGISRGLMSDRFVRAQKKLLLIMKTTNFEPAP